jgi:uridine kinase
VSDPLGGVAAEILALDLRRPLRVLIDGRSAAGKTTLSGVLAARLAEGGRQVIVAHFDEFHPPGYRSNGGSSAYAPERYLGAGFDFAAFRRMVLDPAAPGASGQLALSLDDPSLRAELRGDGILLVDGCFLARPDLRALWDYMVWLDVSFEVMIERAAGRDVAWVGDEARVRRHYDRFWRATHSLYETMGPRESADAIIDNERPAQPRRILRSTIS